MLKKIETWKAHGDLVAFIYHRETEINFLSKIEFQDMKKNLDKIEETFFEIKLDNGDYYKIRVDNDYRIRKIINSINDLDTQIKILDDYSKLRKECGI